MQLLIDDFECELERLAKDAIEIKVLIAFLTEAGLSWIPDKKVSVSRFIVGIDLNITRPEALRMLQKNHADVSIFSEPGKMFHPKSVYIKTEHSEYMIVGSNNLTGSGVGRNHELSLLIERNEQSKQGFVKFLKHFDDLLASTFCFMVDDQFYEQYQPSSIPAELSSSYQKQKPLKLNQRAHTVPVIDASRIATLGQFLRLLAKEFPKLERRRGMKISDHPLKLLNDKKFRPLFNDIVRSVSGNSLEGVSNLSIGGNWHQIPNIIGSHPELELWDNTNNRGRLLLQIHFNDNYSRVHLSLVLHYNLDYKIKDGAMPQPVRARYEAVLEYLIGFSSKAEMDGPIFKHWKYEEYFLWSKPLMSFSHEVSNLPDDDQLFDELKLLASAMKGAVAIQ